KGGASAGEPPGAAADLHDGRCAAHLGRGTAGGPAALKPFSDTINRGPVIASISPYRFISRLISRRSDPHEGILTGPIQGELLGAERLAERAHALARRQRLARGTRRQTPLLGRLDSTRIILAEARERLLGAVDKDAEVGPAGEWLLDNYHVVQEHIGEVRESLPRGYYRELPELTSGPLAGYPRVYELVITLISHTEGRIDLANTSGFVGAFQEVSPLTIGELWAIPAMLRLGLIENVRRMSLRTVQRLDNLEAAIAAADAILAGGPDDASLDAAVQRFVEDAPELTSVFVARFLQRLRAEGGAHPIL